MTFGRGRLSSVCLCYVLVRRFHSRSYGFNSDLAVLLCEPLFGFFVALMFIDRRFRHDDRLLLFNKNKLDLPRFQAFLLNAADPNYAVEFLNRLIELQENRARRLASAAAR
jgi:hypothetical protein